ncbi:bifunctional diaminohydroxyphosphoribosylaminopyrimidine deaminase/5-amino-6-(5-phosphoribosylamino)uracil reductase RibD [Psychrobacter ciconiae]|uniref:bifunctional diaminohydroxyphosphoribosylaminopyrimidine deaminase/5-amino-6-(5-phosphoribosylamino)uracil reductase RibD n=1 Tax=Psychrobacter ciconiae TaxID=1553449 RepID=UPI0019197542|nr:bifunctional diaminohydroxyphosphoribosylaminopyrimidine deaminase/5-amino-6-(5-phosphoribosylamino)uracil reductase RibD [Psychrobacter ciconiae]
MTFTSGKTEKTDPRAACDNYFMTLAIEQAKLGQFTARPNPAVGCVIVKEDKVIGKGFHPKAGMPHAEVFALQDSGKLANGATAYVTLEPCSHTGRTPPCAKALIDAGVRRVVIAGLDPNPKVAGRGVKLLENAGIEVTVGVLTELAEALNQGFLKAMRQNLPYVRLKIATSLDGRTAMKSGESKWITGTAARLDVQSLRAKSGAIITGSETVIQDNPQLNVRTAPMGVNLEDIPTPKVVILDRRERLGFAENSPYHLCQNPETLYYRNDDLKALLGSLVQEHQCYDILVEAGASVAASFLAQGLVDEVIVYQAPCLLGATGRPMVDLTFEHLSEQICFNLISIEKLDKDLKFILKPL